MWVGLSYENHGYNPQTSNEYILPASMICKAKSSYILLTCAIRLHCYRTNIEKTHISHTVALGDMFLNYDEHTHRSLFLVSLTHTVSLP